MPTFTIHGHRLYYEIHGEAHLPPLVLLHHGLGATVEWGAQITSFSPFYQVVAYDRWGYGRSEARPGFEYGYLLEDTQETIALLEHLGIQQACILGHSDGGTIALLLASQRSDLVQAIALEAAHIYYEPKIHTGIDHMLSNLREGQAVAKYLKNLHGEKGLALGEAWLTHWLDANNVPRELVASKALSDIGCPVLVVQGEEDEYATAQHAVDIVNALPNSTLWLIPNCGHVPHGALGEVFNWRVAQFFAEALEQSEGGSS